MSNSPRSESNNRYNWGNAQPNPNDMNRIGFHETQEHLLCGKHALNNILQEEKFVWLDIDEMIIGTDVMNTWSQINLFDLCKVYETEVKERTIEELVVPDILKNIKDTLSERNKPVRNNVNKNGTPTYGSNSTFQTAMKGFLRAKAEYEDKYAGKSDEELIEMIREENADYFIPPDELCNTEFGEGYDGMLPLDIYPKILNMLNYDYKIISSFNVGNVKASLLRILETELANEKCLGVVLNVPTSGGHWTAVVKYRKNCITLTHSRGEPMYAYADSLQCSLNDLEDVKTLEELKEYFEPEKFETLGAVFIYEKADGSSYVSQAQKNRDAMNNNPLNRIKLEGGKRKSRKNTKKTKRSKTRRTK